MPLNKKASKLPLGYWRVFVLCLVATLFPGCRQGPIPAETSSTSPDPMSHQQYMTLYDKWRATVETLPPYSKTTAYTSLKEFSDIVACGRGIVPLLHEKVKEDKGMDFVLCLAVVKIMGWSDEQFPITDMTELRTRVLHKLENPN